MLFRCEMGEEGDRRQGGCERKGEDRKKMGGKKIKGKGSMKRKE